jgi:hypothetical protein
LSWLKPVSPILGRHLTQVLPLFTRKFRQVKMSI